MNEVVGRAEALNVNALAFDIWHGGYAFTHLLYRGERQEPKTLARNSSCAAYTDTCATLQTHQPREIRTSVAATLLVPAYISVALNRQRSGRHASTVLRLAGLIWPFQWVWTYKGHPILAAWASGRWRWTKIQEILARSASEWVCETRSLTCLRCVLVVWGSTASASRWTETDHVEQRPRSSD